MNKKISISLVVVGLAAVSVFIFGFFRLNNPNQNKAIDSPVACTEEAKICPDGSSVGRVGPNCEFAPCPGGDKKVVAEPKTGFCGGSTLAACSSDSDCEPSGCSGQICGAKGKGSRTTCQYKECYNAQSFNLACGCQEGKCQWK